MVNIKLLSINLKHLTLERILIKWFQKTPLHWTECELCWLKQFVHYHCYNFIRFSIWLCCCCPKNTIKWIKTKGLLRFLHQSNMHSINASLSFFSIWLCRTQVFKCTEHSERLKEPLKKIKKYSARKLLRPYVEILFLTRETCWNGECKC